MVGLALVAAALLAGSSGAISRDRAAAVALKLLAPAKVKGAVIVYGLPAPLPPGTVVSEGGPSAVKVRKPGLRGKHVTPLRSWRLTGRAWLFWEDLLPGAYFGHPARLVLVDDATGRVTVFAKLGWYPLVNGRPAPFVLRPTARGFQVFSKAPRTTSGVRTTAAAALPRAAGFGREEDCIVFAADETAPGGPGENLKMDLKAMKGWAKSAGITHSASAKSASQLAAEVAALVKEGCNDVVIFLAGHGLAKPGTVYNGQAMPTSDEATVTIGSYVAKAGATDYTFVSNDITSSDIGGIARKYHTEVEVNGKPVKVATVHFKLIVDSCFAGRFIEDLSDLEKGDDPPIREIATSSIDSRPTIAQVNGNTGTSFWINGITKALNDVMHATDRPDAGDLAAIIDEAVKAERDNPRKYGDRAAAHNRPQTHFAPGTVHPLGEPVLPNVPTPTPPIFHIHVHFIEPERQSRYSIEYTSPPSSPPTSYRWQLTPPQGDPNCSNVDHGGISGDRSTFFWYHGPDQCSHDAEDPVVGHKGTVSVTLEFVFYECKASIYGTQGAADGSDGNGADGTCKKI